MAISGKRELYFGVDDGETFNFEEDTFTDDGTAIASRVRTKNYYLSGPNQIDEIQRVWVYADQPQGGNISISIDDGDYEYLGQVQEYQFPEKFDVWRKGFHFSLGIDEVSSGNFKVKGVNVMYEPQEEVL